MTALWTAQDLVEATGGVMRHRFEATGVSIDTRTLAPGDLFVALRGETGDGHDHLAAAFARGAAGAMLRQGVDPHPVCFANRPLPQSGRGDFLSLCVEDTLTGLSRLGSYARGRFRGRLAAITGSVGKTTTKEMLRRILAVEARTHAAVASYNNHWGVPLTLARLPPDATFCVAEIGMNHRGEIAPLARLARPHVAVITTIERAHVGYLGSIEAIAEEKAAIMQGLPPDGIAVLPADSPWLPLLRANAGGVRVVTFGSAPGADVRLVGVETDPDGTDVEAGIAGRVVRFRLAAPGRHMAMNSVAALAAASVLGVAPERAAVALDGFAAVAGRGAHRRIELPGGSALLLDESYNGNGASMRAALAVLRLQPGRRRIAVLGDMLELGDEGPPEHLALAGDVATAADKLFACGPLMRLLYDAVPPALRARHAPDSGTLAEIVAGAVRPGDAILVKGSLGSGMKLVVSALDRLAELA